MSSSSRNSTDESCSGDCVRLVAIQAALETFKNLTHDVVTQMVERIRSFIPDIRGIGRSTSSHRESRGLVDAVGSLSKYLFGIAKDSDVSSIQDEIKRLKGLAESVSAGATHSQNLMASSLRLQNQRLDGLNTALRQEHESIDVLHASILRLKSTLSFELDVTAYVTRELAAYTVTHDNIEQFELGLEALLHGQLSPRLVPFASLAGLMTNATRVLSRSGHRLCYRTPHEIYENPQFDYTRHDDDVFVRIFIPYTSTTDVSIYRTTIFPMPIPGDHGLTTRLADIPPYLVMDSEMSVIGELLTAPETILDDYNVNWHRAYTDSCIYDLISDIPESVHSVCEFTVRKSVVETTLLKLSPHLFVLSNHTNLRVTCKQESKLKPLTTADCMPCLVELPCECALSTWHGVHLIPSPRNDCKEQVTTTTTLHTVNLAVLQKWYDLSNHSLAGEPLLRADQLIQPQPVNWKLFSSNISRQLAADSELSYSLNKIADRFQNNSFIFHNPSEAVLYDILNSSKDAPRAWTIDLQSWETWSIIGLYVAIILLLASAYRLHQRLNVVVAVSMGLHALPTAVAFGLRTSPASSVTSLPTPLTVSTNASNTSLFLFELIQSVRNVDIALIALFAAVNIVSFTLVARAISRALARQSFLYLQIEAGNQLVHVKLMTFPSATRHYDVELPSEGIQLQFQSYFLFGTLTLNSQNWKVVNILTGKTITAPRYIRFLPWTSRKLADLLQQDYDVTPFTIHTHEYIFAEPQSQPEFSLSSRSEIGDTEFI